jgi:hypothetical protein
MSTLSGLKLLTLIFIMMPGNFESTPLEDVCVALNAQGDTIFLDLLGKQYSDFRVPFSRQEVEQALEDYASNQIGVDPLVAFGSTLFNALFAAERGRIFWEFLGRVTRDNQALRLRILTNLERTQHLPWELLYDGSRSDFVALSGRMALVRTRPDGYSRTASLAALPSLRVLAATADIDASLEAEADLAALQALAQAQPRRLQLQTLTSATKSSLKKALSTQKFDVFVFFGAGALLPDISKAGGLRQELQLIAESDADDGRLNRNKLGEDLRRAGVRLALLDGDDSDWVARSLAKHIPASIGFRETTRRDTRRVVADALFRALLVGQPLDMAVTAARQAIDRAEPGSGEWCRLIFFMQPPDGGFLLAPLPPAEVPRPQTPSAPNREVAKLTRLREVYQTNLDALERNAVARRDEAWREQAEALREKVDTLSRQIDAAEGSGTRDAT